MKSSYFLPNACDSSSPECSARCDLPHHEDHGVVFMRSCLTVGPCHPSHHHEPTKRQPSKHLWDTWSAPHHVVQTSDPWQRMSIGKGLTTGQESLPRKSPGACGRPYPLLTVWAPAFPAQGIPTSTMGQASWLNLGKGCFYGPCL